MKMLSNLPRPCLSCPAYSLPGLPRCKPCTAAHERKRTAPRRAKVAAGDGASWRLRRAITAQGYARCFVCGHEFPSTSIHVDHVVALADGGLDILGNLQPACTPCHTAKTSAEARARRR